MYDSRKENVAKILGEAVVCAMPIINWISTCAIGGMIPYEKRYGSKPLILHFRICGSSVWAHIPKQTKTNWNPSVTAIFLLLQ